MRTGVATARSLAESHSLCRKIAPCGSSHCLRISAIASMPAAFSVAGPSRPMSTDAIRVGSPSTTWSVTAAGCGVRSTVMSIAALK